MLTNSLNFLSCFVVLRVFAADCCTSFHKSSPIMKQIKCWEKLNCCQLCKCFDLVIYIQIKSDYKVHVNTQSLRKPS